MVYGGYELLCHDVACELATRGHDVHVLTSEHEGATPPGPPVHRRLVVATPFPVPGAKFELPDYRLRTMHRIACQNHLVMQDFLAQHETDVVFAWNLMRTGLGPIFAAVRARKPVCWTLNDSHPLFFHPRARNVRDHARNLTARAFYPMTRVAPVLDAVRLVSISHALCQQLGDGGFPIDRCKVIHQGISLERFEYEPCTRSAEPLRLLYAGRLTEEKGVHTLLESLIHLSGRGLDDWTLTVAGAGQAAYEQRLREIVARGDACARVTFIGQQPRVKMPRLYHAHHVLVFPSVYAEPFGLSHLEAMACGCAVVSTLTGGSAELVRDGVNALAFRADDALDLARCLQVLLEGEEMRRALAGEARQFVEREHDFRRYVTDLEAFLEEATCS